MWVVYIPKQTKTLNGRTLESCDNGNTWQDITGQLFPKVMPGKVIKTDSKGQQWQDQPPFRGCQRQYLEDLTTFLPPEGSKLEKLIPVKLGVPDLLEPNLREETDYTPYIIGGAIVIAALIIFSKK